MTSTNHAAPPIPTAAAAAVSAPGKVLLAGGYLVLDRQYTGLVFGLSARMHVHVRDLQTSPSVSPSEIIVKSPQFCDTEWRYGYRWTEAGGGVELTQLNGNAISPTPRNTFVETALSYALTYVATITSPSISPTVITILADDDYYSRTDSTTSITGSRFSNFNVPLESAHKTGLGSSAALVTAFTAAVLTYYLPRHQFDVETLDGKKKLHNLAQAAHCATQGKVGSGFDVAAAVYGTCIYRRFSPSVLDGLGEVSSTAFADRLQALVDDVDGTKWDTETVKGSIKMPAGLRLVMCDVDCGSQTVGMVKRVLAWRKENADEAKSLWDSLQKHNTKLATSLTLFSEGTTLAKDIEECFANIRKLIRDMSNKSGVPIEPESQTKLLDACTSLDSVIGGVVPGAGGYDAVALLVIDDKSRDLSELQTFLDQKWNSQNHGAATTGTIGTVRPLGVREEMEGVKIEIGLEYGEWIRL